MKIKKSMEEFMRTIHTDEITKAVKELCIEANLHLSSDMRQVFDASLEKRNRHLEKDPEPVKGKPGDCRQ